MCIRDSAFIWWKDCENRSSISGNIWLNTPVFLAVLYLTFTNDLVAMATSLDKLENKLLFHHRHLKRFHTVERLRKSVQYVQRYSTKYVEPREHAMQFPFVSLFSAETTGPILTKILHVIVALVLLLMHAYTLRIPLVSEGHSDKVDWSSKNADFSTLTRCHGNVPWKIKPLHLSTNPEILVKIALLVSQLRWLESWPLKKK